MFRKLKKRLVLIYGTTTSAFLTLIIIGVFFLTYNQSQEQKKLIFQKNVEQVVDKIQFKRTISTSSNDYHYRGQREKAFKLNSYGNYD